MTLVDKITFILLLRQNIAFLSQSNYALFLGPKDLSGKSMNVKLLV